MTGGSAHSGRHLVLPARWAGHEPVSALLPAEIGCWDFQKQHTGFGRGMSAVEVSPDWVTWTTLSDDIRDRHWWVNCKLRGNLPPEVLSTDELLLLVRLLTEYAEPRAGYTIAQFRRVMPAEGRTVFAIEADCVSPDEQP
jgi:hypothetical protein